MSERIWSEGWIEYSLVQRSVLGTRNQSYIDLIKQWLYLNFFIFIFLIFVFLKYIL